MEEAFTVISEEIFNKLERGEYSVEEGWDGIKAGYMKRSPASRLPLNGAAGLVEAEPAHSKCCA